MQRAELLVLALGLLCGALAATGASEPAALAQPRAEDGLHVRQAGSGQEGDSCREHDDCAPCWFCVKPTEGGEPVQGAQGKCQQRPAGWCCTHQIFPPIACGVCDHKGTCLQNGQVVTITKVVEAEGEAAGPNRALHEFSTSRTFSFSFSITDIPTLTRTTFTITDTTSTFTGTTSTFTDIDTISLFTGTSTTTALPTTTNPTLTFTCPTTTVTNAIIKTITNRITKTITKSTFITRSRTFTETLTVTGKRTCTAAGKVASLRRALKGAEEERAEETALRSAKVQRALALAQLPDCNCL